MGNKIKLQLIENGEVVQEETTENMIFSKNAELGGKWLNAIMSTMPYSTSNNGSNYIYTPTMNSDVRINLWGNTTSFIDKYYPIYENGDLQLLATCMSLGTTGNAGIDGSYIPSALQYGKGKITYTWEWATTQGNGTYKSIGFTANHISMNSAAPCVMYGQVPLGVTDGYIGYEISGNDTLLYHRSFFSYPYVNGQYVSNMVCPQVNNIPIINETNYSLVNTLSLPVTGGLAGANPGHGYKIDTVISNSNFYTFTATSAGSLSFKKAPKDTLVYGDVITASYTSLDPDATAAHYVQSITSDPTHIYVLVYTATVNKKLMLITIDTTSDSVSEVTNMTPFLPIDPPDLGNYRRWIKIIKNPFISDEIYFMYFKNDYGASIGRFKISKKEYCPNRYIVPEISSTPIDIFYVKPDDIEVPYFRRNINQDCYAEYDHVPVPGGIMNIYDSYRSYSGAIFRSYGFPLNFISYAEFAAPIVKTSAQAMRIQYTLELD